jgi:Protein of unknown function (DUF2877)
VIQATDAGLAWEPYLSGGSTARVLAAFSKATYLQIDQDVVAIVTTDVPRGPLHRRVHQLPTVEVGQSFELEPIGDGHRCWTPAPIDGSGLLRSHPELPSASASALMGGVALQRASEALNRDDLLGAVRALAGLGPGLTPSGDDVLAGMLLVASLTERFSPAELGAAAFGAPTHAISRAFLGWAAKGQSIEPVHDLLLAVASGQPTTEAEYAVAAIGATSGTDLLLGLRLALNPYRGF